MKKILLGSILVFLFPLLALAYSHGDHHQGSGNGSGGNSSHHSHQSNGGSNTGNGGGNQPTVVTPTPPVTPPTGNSTTFSAYLTSYQSGDNDPAGSTGTFIDGISGNAGGVGTYASPITMAVGYVGNTADYAAGTIFYVTQLQKYFTAGDTCASCHSGYQGHVWMDMYSGNYSSQAGLACEDAITAVYTVEENPPSNLPVNTTPLFNGSQCVI